ncbi:hypothetical protein Sjap_015687 [Stephania japonica]|uniref:Uncharacterized protein n=1 Tax=Stephania japonica TaxID=461633 RepID=A0AAP0NT23_9MAGN
MAQEEPHFVLRLSVAELRLTKLLITNGSSRSWFIYHSNSKSSFLIACHAYLNSFATKPLFLAQKEEGRRKEYKGDRRTNLRNNTNTSPKKAKK